MLFLYTFQTRSLNEALKYVEGHLCKSPPTQLVFHLVPMEKRKEYRVEMRVRVSVQSNESPRTKKHGRFDNLFVFNPRMVSCHCYLAI